MTFKERRKTLADFLEFEVQQHLGDAKFDMGGWGYSEDGSTLPTRRSFKKLSECGFAGCAAGWGFYCHKLREEGLPVTRDGSILESTYWSLGKFFGLADPNWIFDPWKYSAEDEDYRDHDLLEVVARLRAIDD